MSYETILVDVADHVATITINRPEAMNSFTRTMMEEFRQLWHEISGIRNFWLIKCQRCKEENLSQRII